MSKYNIVLPRQIWSFYWSSGSCVIMEIFQKSLTFYSRVSWSLKIIGTDTDRSANCDLLLVFHNSGPISYRFRYKWRYFLNFSTSYIFNVPAEGFLLEFCNGGRAQKTS